MDMQLSKEGLGTTYLKTDIKHHIEEKIIEHYITSHFNLLKTNGLDLGCGKRRAIETAIGIDVVRGFSEPYGWYVNPEIIGNADDLPFKDETIDWIINSHLIEHFIDPVTTINEWLRVLKIGGLLVMVVPLAEHTGYIGSEGADPTHFHDYSIESFKEEVIEQLEDVELVEIKDTGIEWSFVVVIRKKTK